MARFQIRKDLEDGQEFRFGKLKVTSIHTPGHTLGCMSYAITDLDSGEEPVIVFTGDALFVNDVGRTDFAPPEKRRKWSENLYDSIFYKLLPLGDHVILCPAHGSGSICGGNIADREWSTLGLERLMNPVLQKSKEEFIEHKVNEHHEYPPYFRMMERYNVEGAPFVGPGPTPRALSPDEFREKIREGSIVLDTRSPPSFGGAHIKGSYSVPTKRLSIGGWLLPYDEKILLVLEGLKDLDYVTMSLCRIGYDNVEGYLGGGLSAWFKAGLPVESLNLLTVHDLKEHLDACEDWLILDVRGRDKWENGHIEGAQNIYLGQLESRLKEVPNGRLLAVICKTGIRASIASSILLRDDRSDVYNVLGGMDAWKKIGYPVTK